MHSILSNVKMAKNKHGVLTQVKKLISNSSSWMFFLSCFCTCFTLYLLYNELFILLTQRPTFSYSTTEKIGKKVDIRIMVCPQPSYNLSTLIDNGYEDYFWYTVGISSAGFSGWSGNKNVDSMQLLDDAMTIKKSDTFPQMVLIYKLKHEYLHLEADYSITKPFYPLGSCIDVVVPRSYKDGSFFLFLLLDKFNNTLLQKINGYKILLMDSLSSSVLKFEDHQMTGDAINAFKNRKGFIKFKVKINKKKNIEHNPRSECQPYSHDFSFDQCLVSRFEEKYLQCLMCVPPWLYDEKSHNNKICNRSSWIGTEDLHACEVLSRDLINGFDIDQLCPNPCTSTFYSVKENMFEPRNDLLGVVVQFAEDIEVSNTGFVLDLLTFMSRLGGIIGVGKELFWLVMLCSGILKCCEIFLSQGRTFRNVT